jgi:hypothetical protein
MKYRQIVVLVIISTPIISSQEIGIDFNVGYTKLKMEQVNDYLDNSESVDYESLFRPPRHNRRLGTPLYYELGISVIIPPFVVRFSWNYLSSSGNWQSHDTIRSINHDVDVSTLEIIASAGYNIPIYKTATILLEGGIGYGFASSEIYFITRSYPFYSELDNIQHSLSGGYLVSRVRGGFEATLKWLILRLVFGYRFANPVVLEGESIINGVQTNNQTVLDNGRELEFDFSGIYYAWGITVLL